MNAILELVASNAIVVTLLAIAVTLVTRFMRRPAVAYWLWFLVLLKLVTLPIVSVPLPAWATVPSPDHSGIAPNPPLTDLPTGSLTHPPTRLLEPRSTAEQPGDRPQTAAATSTLSELPRISPAPIAVPPVGRSLRLRTILLAVWLSGSAAWFALAAYRFTCFGRWLRHAAPAPQYLQETAHAIARRFEITQVPTVLLTSARVPPLLWVRRRQVVVLLPTRLIDALEPVQQAALVAHELAHYRRRDHWVRWLETAVLGLYWWHPVAWWARRRLQQAEEQCCDAWVLWAFPEAARGYALALLETVDYLVSQRAAVPFGASAFGQVRRLECRLRAIVENSTKRSLGWRGRCGLIVLACCVLPLGAGFAAVQSPRGQTQWDANRAGELRRARNNVLHSSDGTRRTTAPPLSDSVPSAPIEIAATTAGGEPDEDPPAEAIRRGIEYLTKQQRADGSWDGLELYRGGVTALCTLALLEAGVAPDDEHVQKALSYLRTLEPDKTYTVALHTMALCAAGMEQDLIRIRRNVTWLEDAQIKARGPAAGSWGYDARGFGSGDTSNSHFAMLALASAARLGTPIEPDTWKRADAFWRRVQRNDGSWGYRGSAGTGSMTCAGITSLALLRRQLHAGADEPDEAIERAVAWLGEHFTVTTNPNAPGGHWHGYYLAALGRAGQLAAIDRFGAHQWRAAGTKLLLDTQDGLSGRWSGIAGLEQQSPVLSTSFALLFLSAAQD